MCFAIWQYYHAVNDPPPSGPPAVSVTAFQVWSTVLGQAITRLIPNGSKWETAITAGGSTIATDDVQTGILRWKAVDPVTGETATFSHNSSGSSRGVKAYEPLGQEISIEDPAGLPDPPPNESVSHWMDMEWGCNRARDRELSFGEMPIQCQIQILQTSFTSPGEFLYRAPSSKQKSPGTSAKRSSSLTFSQELNHLTNKLGNRVLSFSLNSTSKSGTSHDEEDDEEEGGCSYDKEGNPSCAVNVSYEEELIDTSVGSLDENDVKCDKRLADIFGGEGAVFATATEPDTLLYSFNGQPESRHSAAGMDRVNTGGSPNPRESPTNGVAHIYANPEGKGDANAYAYTPPGYYGSPISYTGPNKGNSEATTQYTFNYRPGSLKAYNYEGGLSIVFVHTGSTKNAAGDLLPVGQVDANNRGSIAVGVIGNYGRPVPFESGGSSMTGYFVHNHILFFSLNNKGSRTGRIDPRKVFCDDLNF